MYNNRKLALSIFWIILGVVLIALSAAGILDSNVYSGMGGGLVAVGAMQAIRNLRYRRDLEFKEKMDTEAMDERNNFIRMRSWAWTGYIVVLAQSVGIIIALILKQNAVYMVLSGSVCLILCSYCISYLILNRKY